MLITEFTKEISPFCHYQDSGPCCIPLSLAPRDGRGRGPGVRVPARLRVRGEGSCVWGQHCAVRVAFPSLEDYGAPRETGAPAFVCPPACMGR